MARDYINGGLPRTVLVVDDDRAVLRFVSTVLRRHGYDVLEAASGPEAIDTAKEHAGRLDLLLTDVMMPELDGPALWQKLSRQRPDVRVLYMSGAAEPDGEFQATRFLAKPFSVADLLEMVQRLTA